MNVVGQAREAGAPFSPVTTARCVLRLAATGALATLDKDGGPFSSLVNVATTFAGEPILLLSKLAVHTRNLDRDSRASLLLVSPGGETGDPLAGPRLTVWGKAAPDSDPSLRRRFLARHEEASLYVDFDDFSFYRLKVRSAHLVAGFGRIVDLKPGELLIDCSDCERMIEAEAGAIAHMNEDHANALLLYATRLCGMPEAEWTTTGCDPEGIDLRAGQMRARVDFPKKARTGAELRLTLVDLVEAARSKRAE
jgi:putative heme iron utilization protein